MKRFLLITVLIVMSAQTGDAASMFDDDGNYSGSWKQMTNVSSSSSNKYSSSSYSSSAWYSNNRKQQAMQKQTAYSSENVHKQDAVPFRYNTLNYTRIRKVKGGYGDYNAHCSDIGDVSFCH